MIKKPQISIIIPLLNEQENIESLQKRIHEIMTDRQYEILFVDDGSSDTSWSIIARLARENLAVHGIRFSRNFGYQSALTAGYDAALGDAVITMDSDFQHPPELLPQLIEQWEQGYPIVYAKRLDRKDSWLKKVTANWYYALLTSISSVAIPRHVSDFRLLDRKVVDYIKSCREHHRYLRGLVAWSGFVYTTVNFQQPERAAGTIKNSWTKLITMAVDGLTSFSIVPLRLAAYAGVFVILTGVAMLAFIAIEALFFNGYYPLFKWLVVILYIFMGVQFLLLWLIGEYIGRIYEQQKERPLYIVAEKV